MQMKRKWSWLKKIDMQASLLSLKTHLTYCSSWLNKCLFLSFVILYFWSKMQKYRKYGEAISWYWSALAWRVLNQEICEGKHQIDCQNKTSMKKFLTRLYSWLQTIYDSDPKADDIDKWECGHMRRWWRRCWKYKSNLPRKYPHVEKWGIVLDMALCTCLNHDDERKHLHMLRWKWKMTTAWKVKAF